MCHYQAKLRILKEGSEHAVCAHVYICPCVPGFQGVAYVGRAETG